MPNFYKVGGCVRDELLGTPSKDIDFSVEVTTAELAHDLATYVENNPITAAWEIMRKAVAARCSKVFLETPQFFTIRGLDADLGPVDFVLCRKDGPSSDGRRPDFVEPGMIYDDLARRDFTVNAMAIPEGGTLVDLYDPFNGYDDLTERVLRFVGSSEDRLRQDALRAYRLLRFSITKRMSVEQEARLAVSRMVRADFDAVSTDRIVDELMKCYKHSTSATLQALNLTHFPVLLDLALHRGIWLMPTTKSRT